MLTRRALLATTAASGAAIAAVPALTPDAQAATPKDMAVIVQQIDDIISFDPAESYEFTDNEVDGNCYRKLVTPDPNDGTKIAGDLAEKWDVSPDGLTFTFHLRANSKFESGNTVTAQDAEFSLQRLVKLNKTPGFILTQFGFTPDNVEKLIHATDDTTLVITLPAVQATSFVLYCLTANIGCIVEKAVVMANAKDNDLGNGWLKTHTAGSGPFKLTSWTASDHVLLDVNPHAAIVPRMKRIAIRHVADPSAQLLLLQKGDADIARNLTSDQLKSIATESDYHLASSGQATSMYIAMNQKMPELSKPQVVQAIKWAIDYDSIAKNITPDVWSVSQSILPKGIPGSLSDVPFHRDVKKAKALLAEAGLADGFSVTMDYISHSPDGDIAQAIQADLAAVGIKVQLLPGEQKQVITKTRARTHQLAMLVWGSDYFDPNSNAQAFCANPDDSDASKLRILAWRSHFVNPELTQEVEAAAKEIDSAKRLALYARMQRKFWEVGPFAVILQKNEVAVLRKGTTGLRIGPLPDFTRYTQIAKA